MAPQTRPERQLRVIMLEDSDDDAALLERQLRDAGYTPYVHRTQAPDEFAGLLRAAQWDLILSDYAMPHLDGITALRMVKNLGLDIPFILVSGTFGEDVAVAAMREGAHDYLMKGNLARLIPAIEREVRESQIRRERGHMKKELEWSERKFRSLFRAAADGIVLVNPRGTILDVNPAGYRMLGSGDQYITGKNLHDFLDPRDMPSVDELLKRLASGDAEVPAFEVETRADSRREGRRVLSVSGRFVENPGEGVFIELALRDVTDRKRLERELVENERLASFSQITGFLAHEINTPLTNISLLVNRLASQVPDPEWKSILTKVDEQRRRISGLIANLMKFARQQKTEKLDVDAREIARTAVEQVEVFRHKDVSLVLNLGDRPLMIHVDALQMQEAVANFLKNAYEATAKGSVTLSAEDQGSNVALVVADTGSGIPADQLEKIFEPFFTTKAPGKGTGLGLPWSKALAASNGAQIKVSSEVGRGSRFALVLPKSSSASGLTKSQESLAVS